MADGWLLFLSGIVLVSNSYGYRLRRTPDGTSSSSSNSFSSASSSSGSFSSSTNGGYVGTNNPVPQAFGAQNGASGGVYFPQQAPFPMPDFNAFFQQYFAQMAAAQQAWQQAAAAQGHYNQFPATVSNSIGSDKSGPAIASASASLGSNGGYGQASVGPTGGPDGLGLRIGAEFPPSGNGNISTFSSSASGTSDVNGKRTSFKTASVGVNDNGKVFYKTVSDP